MKQSDEDCQGRTFGILSTAGDRKMVAFIAGSRHAGENLADIQLKSTYKIRTAEDIPLDYAQTGLIL